MSRTPSVRRIWSGSISTLSPDMRRAQVPLGISKIWSREAVRIGASALQARAASALAANAVNTSERVRTVLLFQQNGQVVHVVSSAVSVRHQRPNPAFAIDQIGEGGVRVGVAVLVGHPLCRHTVLLAHRRELRLSPSAADEGVVEASQE